MRAAQTAYTPAQFMEVLQAILYQHAEFSEELISITTSNAPGDTLTVEILSGQQFSITAHTLLDLPVVESASSACADE